MKSGRIPVIVTIDMACFAGSLQPVVVAGPEKGYRWSKTDQPTTVHVIRQIDQQAMKNDIFDTMKGKKRSLIGAAHP